MLILLALLFQGTNQKNPTKKILQLIKQKTEEHALKTA